MTVSTSLGYKGSAAVAEHDESTIPATHRMGASDRSIELRTGDFRVTESGYREAAPREAIGRYRIVRRLGAGGMGTVYEAIDVELERRVAIKVIREDRVPATADARGRLVREARALAKITHPNVVAVFEVGEVEDEVYIAMEYVEGQTLRAWLKEKKRSWEDTLAKFVEAGRGLAAIHHAGLVHRDFKPENVMVGDDGTVRVLDLGLARAASDESPSMVGAMSIDPHVTVTRDGRILGTPAYMAPEQMMGERVDARTDEFGFCVALFEALFGGRPFSGRSVEELRATVVSGKAPKVPERTEVSKRVVAAVLRGLERQRDRRFDTMDELLGALEPRSVGTGLRVAMVAGMVGVLGLGAAAASGRLGGPFDDPCAEAGSALASTWNPERRSRVETAMLATQVPHAAQTWEAVGRVLDDYAQRWSGANVQACQANQAEGGPEVASAQDVDARAGCLARRKTDFDAWIAQLETVDAEALDHALQGSMRLPLLATCANPADAAHTASIRDPELADALAQVGALYRAGRIPDALKAGEAVSKLAETRGDTRARCEADFRMARANLVAGKPEAAVQLLESVIDRAQGEGLDFEAANAWIQLSQVHSSLTKDAAAAERNLDQGRAAARRVGDSLALTIGRLNAEAQYAALTGDLEGAVAAFAENERIERQADAKWTVTFSRMGLAESLAQAGQADRALVIHTEAMREVETLVPGNHPFVGVHRYSFGLTLAAAGRLEESATELERARSIFASAFGEDSERVGNALLAQAEIARMRGDLEAAADFATRGSAIYDRHYGEDTAKAAEALGVLAAVQLVREDFAAAAKAYDRVVRITEKQMGADAPLLGVHLTSLGDCEVELGRLDDAQMHLGRSVEVLTASVGAEHVYAAYAYRAQAKLFSRKGDRKRAAALYDQAVGIWRAEGTPSDPREFAEALWGRAQLGNRGGKPGQADEALAREAMEAFERLGETKRVDQIANWLR